MNYCKLALFGHRDLCSYILVERGLSDLMSSLTRGDRRIELYIGRHGEFDIFAASVIKRLKKKYGDERILLNLVLPYAAGNAEFYEKYYDSIIIPPAIDGTHPKGAIKKRNRWMVEECELFVCYVEHEGGGAYSAMQYAAKLGKRIINLASSQNDEKR